MDVPAPQAGTVKQLSVKIGDRVSEGSVLLTLESDGAGPSSDAGSDSPAAATEASVEREPAPPPPPSSDGAGRDAQVVVIGSGPGGYTAAFRAADLGLKTVLIERYDTLGGVCLNVGCIPSKALLHAARVVAEAEEMAEHGIKFGKPKVDLDELRAWKASVVGRLTGGLAGLAKQRKVEVVTGVASLTGPNTVVVGDRTITFDNCIIAAGSDAASLPALPDDPRIFVVDRRARAAVGPQAAARDRLRDHRPRDGDRVRRARLERDDGRAARPADPGLRPRPGQAFAEADRGALRGDPPRHQARVGRRLRKAPRGEAVERRVREVRRDPGGDRPPAERARRRGLRGRGDRGRRGVHPGRPASCARTCRGSTRSATSSAVRCSPTRPHTRARSPPR